MQIYLEKHLKGISTLANSSRLETKLHYSLSGPRRYLQLNSNTVLRLLTIK